MPFLLIIPVIVGIDIAACALFALGVVNPLMLMGPVANVMLAPLFVILIAALVAIDVCLVCLANAIDEKYRARKLAKYDA